MLENVFRKEHRRNYLQHISKFIDSWLQMGENQNKT